MQILQILFYISLAFIGYAIGRISHMYLGNIKAPHHWIYGLILMIGGLSFYRHLLGITAFCFGVGLFVSDLKDFLQLKFFGSDGDGKKKFWRID